MRPLSVQRCGMGILSHGLLPFPSLLSSHKCSPSLSEPHRFRHMRAFSPRKIEMIPYVHIGERAIRLADLTRADRQAIAHDGFYIPTLEEAMSLNGEVSWNIDAKRQEAV